MWWSLVEEIIGRNYNTARYSNFFTSLPEICYEAESQWWPQLRRWNFWDTQFKESDYFSLTERITVNKADRSGPISESTNNSFKVNKGIRLPDIYNFGYSPSKNPLPFSPVSANSSTKEKWSLSPVFLNKKSRIYLLWQMNNIRIYNGRALIFSWSFQPKPFYKQMLHSGRGSLGRRENWRGMNSADEKFKKSKKSRIEASS